MDPDPEVRRRRLAMLQEIAGLLTRPADLAKLAVG
jgi:glycyl-tRNA synthetase beta subunit